jgi:hypothetical protein
MIRDNVENVLFDPTLDNTYNNTFLNCYYCDPFFMGNTNDQRILLDDLSNGSVGNFYWNGHGSEQSIGSSANTNQDAQGYSSFTYSDVETSLGNLFGGHLKGGWSKRAHPYRLVILDSCSSADGIEWAKAFGIIGNAYSASRLRSMGYDPQAFVGWVGSFNGPFTPTDMAYYGEHLNDLFELWMSDVPLDECVGYAASYYQGAAYSIYDMPLGDNWKIYGDPILTRSPQ